MIQRGETLTMHRHILLTGATGALGPALAAELARGGAAERIAVLMRGEPAEVGERFARWRKAVESLLLPEEVGHADRLYPVAGDVCLENLGLQGDSAAVQRETDMV